MIDDLVEMAMKVVGILIVMFIVAYGGAWVVDSIGVFNTDLTGDLTGWVTGIFGGGNESPGELPPPESP